MKNVKSFPQQIFSRLTLVIPALLSVAAILFYLPSLRYGFMFDDLPTIVEYRHIQFFNPWEQFFSNSRWISRIMHQLLYKWYGATPMPYRVVNLSMHVISGILMFALVYNVCKRLQNNEFLQKQALLFSSLATGLFLLHPVQTQTVTYITQMSLEGLVVLFTFAILLTYFFAAKVARGNAKIGLYALSYVLALFAAGTKEIIVTLPFLLVLFDWFLVSEGQWHSFKKRIPLMMVFFLMLGVVFNKLGAIRPKAIVQAATTPVMNNRGNRLTEKPTEKITPGSYGRSQFKVITHYMTIFFWPFNISFDYDMVLSKKMTDSDVLFPLLFLLSIIALCLYLFVRNLGSLVAFSFGWFFIGVLPRASFFPAVELVCDYKTYISSFGMMFLLALIAVHVINFVAQNFDVLVSKQQQVAAVLLLLVGAGYASKVRNKVWSSELLFWKDCIENAPKKARAWNNYAVALWETGSIDNAIKSFNKASECDPTYGEPHVNLGTIYQISGKKDLAFEHYKKAVESGEGHPQLYFNLAVLHSSNDNQLSAEYCFKEAIKLRPYYSAAHAQLGKLYQQQKRMDKALASYEKGLSLDPNNKELRYLCAYAYHDSGNIDQAIKNFELIDKGYLETAFVLGSCYYQKHKYDKACINFEKACRRDSNNLTYAYNYAQALLNCSRFREAIPFYEKCLHDKNTYAFAPLHLVRCLAEVGNTTRARVVIDDVLQTSPHAHIKEEAQRFKNVLRNA